MPARSNATLVRPPLLHWPVCFPTTSARIVIPLSHACRFALQALYGHGEPSLIEGIKPISPLDVLDLVLLHRRDNAFILDTWTL